MQKSSCTTKHCLDQLPKSQRKSKVGERQQAAISKANSLLSLAVQLEKPKVLKINFKSRSASFPSMVYQQVDYDRLLKKNSLKKETDSKLLDLDNKKLVSSSTSSTKSNKTRDQYKLDDNIFSDDVFLDTTNNNWMTKPHLDQNLILELAEKSSGELAPKKTTQPKNFLKMNKGKASKLFHCN